MLGKDLKFKLFIQLFADDGADPEDSVPGEADEGDEGNDPSEGAKNFSQAEVDELIQKRIAREKKTWEKKLAEQKAEAEKLADMDEKAKKKYHENKKLADLEQREKEISKRELTAQAKEILAGKGLPLNLSSLLDYTDAEKCNESITTVEKLFNDSVSKAVEDKLKGSKPIKKSDTSEEDVSEEDRILKMMLGK